MSRCACGRRARALLALAALVCAVPALAAAPKAKPRRATAPSRETVARPDRALYEEAVQARNELERSPARQRRPADWERVVMRYRRVVARYPQSGYCDNGLLAVGELYREMARRFGRSEYRHDAVQAFRAVVAEYPSSSLGEKALYAVFEIARERGDRREVADAGRAYLAAFPDSPRAAQVKAETRARGRVQEAALPAAPRPGLTRVFNLRFWSGESSTRVVLDLEKPVKFRHERLRGPDRLFVDLPGARLHPNLKDRSFPVGDGLLEQIRIAQNQDDVVRVVLDFEDVREHNVFYLANPTRLVLDVRGAPRPAVASALPAVDPPPPEDSVPPRSGQTWIARADPSPAPSPEPLSASTAAESPEELALGPAAVPPPPDPRPAAAPPMASAGSTDTGVADPAEAAPAGNVQDPAEADGEPGAAPERLPARRLASLTPPAAALRPAPPPRSPLPLIEGAPAPPPRRATASRPSAAPHRAAGLDPTSIAPPQVNRAGSYSLARQLGLGARTIVIDPGHGGHDPGSIGRGGLQEKDLVLDVAQRLEKLVRSQLGAGVIMTRNTDVFIPLEERTAIANSRGADLFLSIHANSSRSTSARGVETYFLAFAADAHAEAVAARENAISAATLKDLQNLVKAIALNSKVDESRDFAASVHEAMMTNLKEHDPRLPDRGVRTAPFYVLIGANMPSILAEIAFVSHPGDEKRLRTPDHRDRIARSLFEGVRRYLEALNRTQMRQLTRNTSGSTVARERGRR